MMGSMMRRGSFGDGATLSLDFTTGTLDPLLTFTRSSSGTYLGADGLVKTASTNGARFEYDTSGNPLGLLLEGAATNLLAHTERLDEAQVSTEQYWVTSYTATGVTASVTGPDGVSNSSTQFAAIGGNGTCIASAAMGTSAQRSFSFWAKRSSGSTNLEYTLDNGTNWVAVTTTSSWQRFTIAATTAAQRVGFRFAANNVYEIWGCQLEARPVATSYIKNVSAAAGASRSADFAAITGSNFTNWFTQNNTHTFFADFTPQSPAGSFLDIFRMSNSGGQGYQFYYYNAATLISYSKITAATGPELVMENAVPYGIRKRYAYSVNVSPGSFYGVRSVNGNTIAVATPTAQPSTPTWLGIGSSGASTFAMFGHYRAFKYFPFTMTQTEINAMTA